MTRRPIDVSVVIVSWNVRDFLRRSIESIDSSHGDLSIELIVVDNASVDGSIEMVRVEFPHVHTIDSGSNIGFARANNIALGHATGRYVFFLNPDTLVSDKALLNMVHFLDSHTEFAAVGPRLLDADGAVQPICARMLPSLSLALFHSLYIHRLPILGDRLQNRLISPYDLDQSQEVEAISGAAMLVRRNGLEIVGGFDESFLYTAEDIDLCMRLRRRVGRVFYLADAEVVHFGGQSSAQAFSRAGTMSILSTAAYFERSQGRRHALVYRLSIQFFHTPALLLVGLVKFLFGRGTLQELMERVNLAKAVWRWRVSE
jgi:GT2 family glycosyltransferase